MLLQCCHNIKTVAATLLQCSVSAGYHHKFANNTSKLYCALPFLSFDLTFKEKETNKFPLSVWHMLDILVRKHVKRNYVVNSAENTIQENKNLREPEYMNKLILYMCQLRDTL